MSMKRLRRMSAVLCLLGACAGAQADEVFTLSPTPLVAGTYVNFGNPSVAPGTVSGNGAFNFLDQWQFTLDGAVQATAIDAAIAFTDPSGQVTLQGITDLQLALVPTAGGPALVSWETVTTPASGLVETVALIPNAALGAGAYTLEVRGDLTQPGAYFGQVAVNPPATVPLPGPTGLLTGGLAVLGLLAWRRRPDPAGGRLRA